MAKEWPVMDDFLLYFLRFFSVFRRTVGQSPKWDISKPKTICIPRRIIPQIWAHWGSPFRRSKGTNSLHSYCFRGYITTTYISKVKTNNRLFAFFYVVYSFQIFYIRNKKLSYKSISFQIILLFLAFNIIMKEKLSLKYTFILLIISWIIREKLPIFWKFNIDFKIMYGSLHAS